MVNNKINKHDVIFATMTPKEAMEWTGGHDKEKIDHLRKVKAAAHQNEAIKNAETAAAKNKKNFDENSMKSWVTNTTALNKNPNVFKKEVKKFNMDKHVVDTLNKYEDGPDIMQQVINYSPTKIPQKNKKILPKKNQKDEMSMWDMMKESARMDARKGDHTGMRQIKKTLHDDYKKSGGKWMSDEEKKMIGKYKQPEPIKLDLSTVTKGRLLLQQMREDDKRLEEQRKKIFEKKSGHENIGGLAYLLNTNK